MRTTLRVKDSRGTEPWRGGLHVYEFYFQELDQALMVTQEKLLCASGMGKGKACHQGKLFT